MQSTTPFNGTSTPAVQSSYMEEGRMTPERTLMMAAGVVQYVLTQKWWVIVPAVGVVLAVVLGVRGIVQSRRRQRHWTERLAERFGLEFNAKEAEATLKNLSREVERLRRDVEQRVEAGAESLRKY